jgi:multimeric flavodoxin WrbA
VPGNLSPTWRRWVEEGVPLRNPLAISVGRFSVDAMTQRFVFLTSSARTEGNSLLLARLAARSISADDQCWLDLTDPPLPPYRDLRPGHGAPEGRLLEIMQAMQAATNLVLVAPIYWYALPAPAKLLLDHWSGWFDAPETGFQSWARGLTVHLVTARADPDPSVTELPEGMVKRSIEWLGMTWGGALHGVGDARGEILADTAAMAAAERFLKA